MTTPTNDPLDRSLRGLSPILGHDDWPDLKRRLGRRRTFRSRLFGARSSFRWALACMAILLGIGTWQTLQGRRAVASSGNMELRTWVSAHQDAVVSDSIVDPWTETLAESTP